MSPRFDLVVRNGTLVIPGVGKALAVTAILPNDNIYMERVISGAYILNGAGEVSGLIQIQEWGLIETPILLTNTLSVGVASHPRHILVSSGEPRPLLQPHQDQQVEHEHDKHDDQLHAFADDHLLLRSGSGDLPTL